MRTLALLLLSITTTLAGPRSAINGWLACDTGGRNVTVTKTGTDLVTLAIPVRGQSRPGVVSFLYRDGVYDLTGATISATFFIATTGTPGYMAGYTGGCTTPANFRIYFATRPGPYKLNDGEHNPGNYWWSHEGTAYVQDVDGGQLVTFTATIDSLAWSHALGGMAVNNEAEFRNASANAHLVGFSFGGGCFYDTGICVYNGTATLHLVSYTIE